MSFGFSLGDFFAATRLFADIIRILGSTSGSTSEYQELIRELESLDHALGHVDRLEGSTAEPIKHAATKCRQPLDHFQSRVQKYHKSLGPGQSNGFLKDSSRKLQWAFTEKEEIRKLRDDLSLHIGSINMVLMCSNFIPRVDSRFTYAQDPIKVEDALGRVFPFPSEFDVDCLRAIIHHRFEQGPGSAQVETEEYELFDSDNLFNARSMPLVPGMSVTMAIILTEMPGQSDTMCPILQCQSPDTLPIRSGRRCCTQCGVKFDERTDVGFDVDEGARALKRSKSVSRPDEEAPELEAQEQDDSALFRNVRLQRRSQLVAPTERDERVAGERAGNSRVGVLSPEGPPIAPSDSGELSPHVLNTTDQFSALSWQPTAESTTAQSLGNISGSTVSGSNDEHSLRDMFRKFLRSHSISGDPSHHQPTIYCSPRSKRRVPVRGTSREPAHSKLQSLLHHRQKQVVV